MTPPPSVAGAGRGWWGGRRGGDGGPAGGAGPGQPLEGETGRSGAQSRYQRLSSLSRGRIRNMFNTIYLVFLNTLESLACSQVMKSINCTDCCQWEFGEAWKHSWTHLIWISNIFIGSLPFWWRWQISSVTVEKTWSPSVDLFKKWTIMSQTIRKTKSYCIFRLFRGR